jgi:hypothetical protein
MKALSKAPSDRFQSAAEMRAAIESAVVSMGDTVVRRFGPEYVLRFATEQGEIDYSAAIAHGETLASIMDELINDLNAQDFRLKNHQPGVLLRVTANGRELDQALPLRRQGVKPGETLLIQSAFVQQREELVVGEFQIEQKYRGLSIAKIWHA